MTNTFRIFWNGVKFECKNKLYNNTRRRYNLTKNYFHAHPGIKRGLKGAGATLATGLITALVTPNSGLEQKILEPITKTAVAVVANQSLKNTIGRENILEGYNTAIDLTTYSLIAGAYLRGIVSGLDNILEEIPHAGKYLSYPFEAAKQFLNKNLATKLIAALVAAPTYLCKENLKTFIRKRFT